jgi:hypothetical protein
MKEYQYPPNRRLGGLQSQSGRFWRKENLFTFTRI